VSGVGEVLAIGAEEGAFGEPEGALGAIGDGGRSPARRRGEGVGPEFRLELGA
jgi:hypothetical protein